MSTGKFLGGLLIGGALGAAVGLLLAPRSGEETRGILKSEFNNRVGPSVETVRSKTVELKERAIETAEVLKERGQQIAAELEEAGREALTKLRTPAGVG